MKCLLSTFTQNVSCVVPKGRCLLSSKANSIVDCTGHPTFYIVRNSIGRYVCTRIVGTGIYNISASYSAIKWHGGIPVKTSTMSVLVVQGNKKAKKNWNLQEIPVRNLGHVTIKKPWKFTFFSLVFASPGFNTKNSALYRDYAYIFFMILAINRKYWSTTKQHAKGALNGVKRRINPRLPDILNHHRYSLQ
jgi:hypothetical protein